MNDRRVFLQQGLLFALAGSTAWASDGAATAQPHLWAADEGEEVLFGPRRARVLIKVDKTANAAGDFSVATEDIAPGHGIPPHKHTREDEFIYVARGSGMLLLGEAESPVAEGAFAFVPRDAWHGLRNTGTEPLRMFFGYSPGGFEGYFRELGVKPGAPARQFTADDWRTINTKYGIIYR